ncbi:MAG TPA: hypothetical protein VEK38_03085 [Candidatus Bathyarchaeia archaeon]|nr:hypothetical protein [Candidatus Bathyarchaeia archaeon]
MTVKKILFFCALFLCIASIENASEKNKKTRRVLREECCQLLGDMLYATTSVLSALTSNEAVVVENMQKSVSFVSSINLVGGIQKNIMDLLTPCLRSEAHALLMEASRNTLQQYTRTFKECMENLIKIENILSENTVQDSSVTSDTTIYTMLCAVQQSLQTNTIV